MVRAFFISLFKKLKRSSELEDSGCGVFSITNLKTGKKFIGHSSDLSKEEEIQRFILGKGLHRNARLQGDYDSLGEDSFSYEIERAVLAEKGQHVTLWNLLEISSTVKAEYVEEGTKVYNQTKTVKITTETYLDMNKGRKK